MGKFTAIPQSTFEELQLDAGVILKNFTPATPTAPKDEDIVCATTGGINVSCVPTYSDMGEDVDNCPVNIQYFLQIPLRSCETCGNDRAFPPKCAQKMQAVFAYSPRLCAMCAPRKEKGMVKSVNGQLWYCCPVCGQKLHKLSPDAVCNGVTTFCRRCKWEGVMVVKKGA